MNLGEVIGEPLRLMGEWLAFSAPRILGAIVIVVAGWALAKLVKQVLARVLRALQLDRLAEKARLSEILRQGEVHHSFSELLGMLSYWLIMIAVVIVAMQTLGVTAAHVWLERFGYFLPRIISSIVMLLFGMLVASFLSAAVRAASLNTGFPHGHLLGQAIYFTVVFLSIIVALEQLQVVTRTIEVALYILLAACGLGFALAVGLGSQDTVRQYLAEIQERRRQNSRHDALR